MSDHITPYQLGLIWYFEAKLGGVYQDIRENGKIGVFGGFEVKLVGKSWIFVVVRMVGRVARRGEHKFNSLNHLRTFYRGDRDFQGCLRNF
jgi:hypothetical protein